MRETKSQEPGKSLRHFTAHAEEYEMVLNLKHRADFQGKKNELVKGIDGTYIFTEETIVI